MTRHAGARAKGHLRFRDHNAAEIAKLEAVGDGNYADMLRAAVGELGILSERQSIPQTEQIFETGGERRSVAGIVKGFAPRDVSIVDGIVVDNGYVSAAGPRAAKQGIFQADISHIPIPTKHTPGWVRQSTADHAAWQNDPVISARFAPEQVPATETRADVLRAMGIGEAERTNDRAAVFEANKRYDFTPEEATALGQNLLIGQTPLYGKVQNQGLGGERNEGLIDPATGRRVADYSKEGRLQYMHDRGDRAIHKWLEQGATSFGDGRSDIAIPGFNNQLEHDRPFSGSIDAGVAGSQYLSDTDSNLAGMLERYENAEKNDIAPEDYNDQRRLIYLAGQEGLPLYGIKKGQGRAAGQLILDRDNPASVTAGRGKKRATTQYPERAGQNQKLLDLVYGPENAPLRERSDITGSTRNNSEGHNQDVLIDSDGGDITIGDDVIRQKNRRFALID